MDYKTKSEKLFTLVINLTFDIQPARLIASLNLSIIIKLTKRKQTYILNFFLRFKLMKTKCL